MTAINAMTDGKFASEALVTRFFKALNKLRPTVRTPVASWDLVLVLDALNLAPFEPIEEVDLKWLSMKLLFLVAVTSAKRVGELQALSAREPYLRILPDGVRLRTLPLFRPKVANTTNINKEVFLPVFYPEPESEEQEVASARCINKGKKASKDTLARWIRMTIVEAYVGVGKEPPAPLRAHSTHSTTTSWAEREQVPLMDICSAASWSSSSTFVKHFRLDFQDPNPAFSTRVLSAACRE
ncbi:uncharacterized protein LOC130311605 isoform X2 [Hyla sarda]|uniref:uncharacterized protein LOC130311605 isoform X2 n=1 Tax=Hyla sarda TaxID=327740 RepID=UPI0024C28F39|nr:uncharacterized protein LOC130311605 isoform X2 [Hyla sarda]